MRRSIATATLGPVAAFLVGCSSDSGGDEGGADLPRLSGLDLLVVAASSEQVSGWVYPRGLLEVEDGKSFWIAAAGSSGGEPARLSTNLRQQGVPSTLFQTVFYQDAPTAYAALLDEAADNRYYIAYNEDGSAEGASFITVPDPFQVTAPLSHEIVSLANDLVVKWNTPGDVDRILVHGAVFCDGRSQENWWYTVTLGSAEASGTHTIPGSSMSHEFLTDSCPLTIEVAAGREGTLGAAFGSSEVFGYRTSTVTLTATN